MPFIILYKAQEPLDLECYGIKGEVYMRKITINPRLDQVMTMLEFLKVLLSLDPNNNTGNYLMQKKTKMLIGNT